MKHSKTILVSILFFISTHYVSASDMKTSKEKAANTLAKALLKAKINNPKNPKKVAISILKTTDPDLAKTILNQKTNRDEYDLNNPFFVGSISKSNRPKIIELCISYNKNSLLFNSLSDLTSDSNSESNSNSESDSNSNDLMFLMDSDSE